MRILLVGGGSGGPTVPLLAVAEEIKKDHSKAQFLFVGTKKGPERFLAEKAKMDFVSIPAGKWRRYFSIKNFFTPFMVFAGFVSSFIIL
jgi:UDP-N-acetylglucosamine--N-acetylmuramyl-(pentapeptide) pyrophosphoryl-undecaprenol N-acetylglucosamine transferase